MHPDKYHGLFQQSLRLNAWATLHWCDQHEVSWPEVHPAEVCFSSDRIVQSCPAQCYIAVTDREIGTERVVSGNANLKRKTAVGGDLLLKLPVCLARPRSSIYHALLPRLDQNGCN